MNTVLNIYKPAGVVPSDIVHALREQEEYRDARMCYAGRLDPMAEGVLLILVGNEVDGQDAYMDLDKVYEVTVLLGFSTDTQDGMGLPSMIPGGVSFDACSRVLSDFVGEYCFDLPWFSSYKINGKPLFYWARNGKGVQRPRVCTQIYSLDSVTFSFVAVNDIFNSFQARIARVRGDFRQDAILAQWETLLKGVNCSFPAITFRVHCSSGTYIRALVRDFSLHVGLGGILYSLRRIQVGTFCDTNSLRDILAET